MLLSLLKRLAKALFHLDVTLSSTGSYDGEWKTLWCLDFDFKDSNIPNTWTSDYLKTANDCASKKMVRQPKNIGSGHIDCVVCHEILDQSITEQEVNMANNVGGETSVASADVPWDAHIQQTEDVGSGHVDYAVFPGILRSVDHRTGSQHGQQCR
jgi:hypothetical protein